MSADRTLTIAAGATGSTGTVKVTAVDNAVDGPDKEMTVTAAVTGPGGLTDPPAETLTITDEDAAAPPTVTLALPLNGSRRTVARAG